MYLGYALHPLQDKEAHGQIGRGKSTPQHLYLIRKVIILPTQMIKPVGNGRIVVEMHLKRLVEVKKDIMQLLQ